MPRRILAVTAPSRLHFGLFAFGVGHEIQFGGVGLMIDRPMTRVRFAHSSGLKVGDSNGQRLRQAVENWFAWRAPIIGKRYASANLLPLSIRLVCGPDAHIGLGSGTQLALAVAAGLEQWFRIDLDFGASDAASLGRARRSAIGSHGFFSGGLIIERGKSESDSVGELDERIDLPKEWCVVLACPRGQWGPFGEQEDRLFENLSPVDIGAAEALRQLVREQLAPSARAGDFSALGEAIYQFGYGAGHFYGPWQNGPFSGPVVSELVAFIRSLGIRGVGQSSWGPCVFALCHSREQALSLLSKLRTQYSDDRFWFDSSDINREGYSVSECVDRAITMEQESIGPG